MNEFNLTFEEMVKDAFETKGDYYYQGKDFNSNLFLKVIGDKLVFYLNSDYYNEPIAIGDFVVHQGYVYDTYRRVNKNEI